MTNYELLLDVSARRSLMIDLGMDLDDASNDGITTDDLCERWVAKFGAIQ